MAMRFSKLINIRGDREIRKDGDYDCWYSLEQGLLLALRESGTLNAMQYRLAEEALREQRAERARRRMKEESE